MTNQEKFDAACTRSLDDDGYREDCERIVRVATTLYITMIVQQASIVWQEYSKRSGVGWLPVGIDIDDSEIKFTISNYIHR